MSDKTNSVHKLNGHGTLEQRIASTLADSTVDARQLADLVTATEAGIADADTIAQRLEEAALDLVASPDAKAARETAEFATLIAKRLRTVLPRLQQKHQQVAAQERRARWNMAADVRQGERDAMAQEFAEKYPALVNQLVDLFERIRTTNQDVDGINGAAPNSESRRVSPIGHQQILATTKLLSLAGQPLWPPPPAPILPEQVLQAPPHPGRNWAQAIEQRNREQHAESQRVANYYAQQTKAREDRENAEARAARARNGGTL